METKIEKFWNYLDQQKSTFHNDQKKHRDVSLYDHNLSDLLKAISKDLDVLVIRKKKPKLLFICKGRIALKRLALQFIKEKPENLDWKYQIGIPPYVGTIQEFDLEYNLLGEGNFIFEIYFSIAKVYPSTKRMHLNIYVETNKRFTKLELQPVVKMLLLLYLGDDLFYKEISKIKILLRKFSHLNLAPLQQLKVALSGPEF